MYQYRSGASALSGSTVMSMLAKNSGDLHTGVKDGEPWMKVEQVLVLSDSLLIRGDDGLF